MSHFESAAYAVIQALSPSKNVRKHDVPFDFFRQVLDGFSEKRSKSEPSAVDANEGVSSYSSPDMFAECSVPLRKMNSIEEKRRARKEAAATQQICQFDCDMDGLGWSVRVLYSRLVKTDSPVTAYLILLNSLHAHFLHLLPEDDLERSVAVFIRKNLLKEVDKLGVEWDPPEDEEPDNEPREPPEAAQRVRDAQLQVLLELLSVQFLQLAISDTSLVAKLRLIYVEDSSQRMRMFLEDEVTDYFGEWIPRELCELFDALDVTPPLDLVPPHEWSQVENMMKETEMLLNSPSKTTPPLSLPTIFGDAIDDKSERSMSSDTPAASSRGSPRPPRSPTRRRVCVPETPDEKLKPKQRKEENQVVKQTPMEKVNRLRRSARADKLAELANTASPKRTCRVAAATSKASKSIATTSGPPTTKRDFLSLNRPLRTCRARTNLFGSFEDSEGKSKEKEKEKEGQRGTKREREKDTKQSPVNNQSPPLRKARLPVFEIDPEALEKYKKRMEELKKEKGEGDEVFYGRTSGRTGLFDSPDTRAVNRSGRVIYSPSCVFAAHTLLNVHNPTPLLPPRPPTGHAHFRLSRLVRAACKTDRKKLNKLRVRFQQANVNSPKKEAKETFNHPSTTS